jgi:cytochrome c5
MTIDAHPTTDADRERAQRECVHAPDRDRIEADDTDHATGETVYVAECRRCFAHIQTGYIDGDPEDAEWGR